MVLLCDLFFFFFEGKWEDSSNRLKYKKRCKVKKLGKEQKIIIIEQRHRKEDTKGKEKKNMAAMSQKCSMDFCLSSKLCHLWKLRKTLRLMPDNYVKLYELKIFSSLDRKSDDASSWGIVLICKKMEHFFLKFASDIAEASN